MQGDKITISSCFLRRVFACISRGLRHQNTVKTNRISTFYVADFEIFWLKMLIAATPFRGQKIYWLTDFEVFCYHTQTINTIIPALLHCILYLPAGAQTFHIFCSFAHEQVNETCLDWHSVGIHPVRITLVLFDPLITSYDFWKPSWAMFFYTRFE